MKKIKTVIIGHVCIDYNVSEKTSYVAAGGPAIFIAKIFNQFKNCRTTIVAPYGKNFSRYIKKNTFYRLRLVANHTLIYKNFTNKGLRIQKVLYQKNATPVKIKGEVCNIIKQADIIFIAPLLPNFSSKYIQQINKLAKRKAVKILLPQGYFRDFNSQNKVILRKFSEVNKILPFVDFVIVSDQDYPKIKQLSSNWVKNNKAIFIITLGEKGALIVDKNKKIKISTIAVPNNKIVDSVGSGDIFSAGFAYNYIKTKSLKMAVIFANKLARKNLFYAANEIK